MKKKLSVVSPAARIMNEFDDVPLAQRIEICGRICYKSEEKITPDSAIGFCKGIVKQRHNSVLEMAVHTFVVKFENSDYLKQLLWTVPKFLVIDELEPSGNVHKVLITGSIRSFRELVLFHSDCIIGWVIAAALWSRYSYFFEDITPPLQGLPVDIGIRKLSLEEVDRLSPELHIRHRHVAAKIVSNRAVTHEIVRHRPCSFLQESQRYCRYSEKKFGNQVTFVKPMFFPEDSREFKLWHFAMVQTEYLYLELLKTSSPQAARTVLPNSCKTEIIIFANLVEWEHIFHLRTSEAAEPSMREVMIPLQRSFQEKFPQYLFNRRMPEGWNN